MLLCNCVKEYEEIMKPSIKNLAMRDSALAVLVGALAPTGSDFGGEHYEFGADGPTPENMQAAWNAQSATRRRQALMSPNEGSAAKIQRYAFGVSQILTLSTAVAIDMTGQPDVNFRPQRVTCNAPLPGFASLTTIKVANVSVIVGGTLDCYEFTAEGTDQSLDVPTLSPANKVRVQGQYSGLLPTGGYVTATAYLFTTSFKGPADMAG